VWITLEKLSGRKGRILAGENGGRLQSRFSGLLLWLHAVLGASGRFDGHGTALSTDRGN